VGALSRAQKISASIEQNGFQVPCFSLVDFYSNSNIQTKKVIQTTVVPDEQM